MRALSAAEMLDVWERGLALLPVERSLMLLAAAGGESPAAIAALAIGERNARLLALREWAFGQQIIAVESCPRCGDRLELNFSTTDLKPEIETPNELPQCFSLNIAGYDVECRAVNSQDLLAISAERDPVAARRQLLERCFLNVARNGDEISAGQLPEEVIRAVAERLEQADPQANIQLALICAQCGHQWQSDFDIVAFFWNEIHSWATRTLHEVHVLASAYGWREMDILTMSPWRRQYYLNCIGK